MMMAIVNLRGLNPKESGQALNPETIYSFRKVLYKAKKDRSKRSVREYIFYKGLLYAYYPFDFRGMLLDGIFHPQLQG